MTAILYIYDTYCEVVFSNGEKFTGKKTIIEGYCKKNNIKIKEVIDRREKKKSMHIDPFNPRTW